MNWESRSEAASSGIAEDVSCRVASPHTPALLAHGAWFTTGRGGELKGKDSAQFPQLKTVWRFSKSVPPVIILFWGRIFHCKPTILGISH